MNIRPAKVRPDSMRIERIRQGIERVIATPERRSRRSPRTTSTW